MKLPNQNPPFEVLAASKLLHTDRKLFAALLAEAYALTDEMVTDHQQYHEDFWTRYIPGIFSERREILGVVIDTALTGVAILKRDDNEPEISVLYVCEEQRNRGVGEVLYGAALRWLGTDQPVLKRVHVYNG
jgi:GNAT superfamily N-acetyltransferase